MPQKSKRGCDKTKEDGVAIRKDAANQGVAPLSAHFQGTQLYLTQRH